MTRLGVLTCAVLSVFSGCDLYCRATVDSCGSDAGEVASPPSAQLGQCLPPPELDAPIQPLRPPPPVTGGNLAAVGDGTWIVADADRAVVWHLGSTLVLAKVSLADDDFPGRVLTTPSRAYVVLRRAGQIGVIDLTTHALSRWDTCVEPRGLALQGERLLVGCATGTVEAFSASGERTVLFESRQLQDLRDLEVAGDRVLASTFRNAQIFELRENGPRVLSSPITAVAARGQLAAPRVAWRMRQGLVVAQNEQLTPLPSSSLCGGAYGGTRLPDGGVPPGPVSTVLYRVEGTSVAPVAELTRAVVAVDLVETEHFIFVVSAGTSTLERLDKSTGALVTLPLPGQATSIEASGGNIVVFIREPAQLLVLTEEGEVSMTLDLGAASAFSTGHDIFHRSTPTNIACASCHPEAGDDAHVWQFNEGPRRTPSLRGGLASTTPFHWDGTEADMAAVMSDVMTIRMSGAEQTPERTAALTHWLDGVPGLRAPPVNTISAARGRALFTSSAVGCASCHAGAQGTNNTAADVGTGGPFQVPRLTELFWRTPLLHDGSVKTLEARVSPVSASNAHGHLGQLSAEERADLLEYLKTR